MRAKTRTWENKKGKIWKGREGGTATKVCLGNVKSLINKFKPRRQERREKRERFLLYF